MIYELNIIYPISRRRKLKQQTKIEIYCIHENKCKLWKVYLGKHACCVRYPQGGALYLFSSTVYFVYENKLYSFVFIFYFESLCVACNVISSQLYSANDDTNLFQYYFIALMSHLHNVCWHRRFGYYKWYTISCDLRLTVSNVCSIHVFHIKLF